ncbi:MAG: MFS transporter [Holosporaceae bacterium]|jgi:predicted MFS family arabinose efflux permease|nr:MFS transporter [Holosporaceae bacterium]
MHWLPSRKIVMVAAYAFLVGVSTQMLYSHLALFLKFELNISESRIGLIDGVAEFTSRLVRVFSGALSDYMGDRRFLLLVGCSLACLAKPIFSMVGSLGGILFAEMLERLASGIQACPRDAWVADLSIRVRLGESFGFLKSLKTLGTIFGASAALALMYASGGNYRILFACASIPTAIAVVFLLKIPATNSIRAASFKNPFRREYLKSLDLQFVFLMAVAFFCEFIHFGEALMILRAGEIASPTYAGLTAAAMGLGQTVLAYPIGILSDKYEKTFVLKVCMLLASIFYGAMDLIDAVFSFFALVALIYGLHAAVQSVLLSMVVEIVSKKLHGTAIGIFHCLTGLAYLTAARIFGNICEHSGYKVAFFCNAIVGIFGSCMVTLYQRHRAVFNR